MSGKVFVIGFHKTGTTSMGQALRMLGYRVDPTHWKDEVERLPAPLTLENLAARAVEKARESDAFEDNPWPILFREMDAAFPGSKFILTRRAPGAWADSIERHFGEKPSKLRALIYGDDAAAPAGHRTRYVCRYQRHIDEVLQYFAQRPDDLLILSLETAGWPALCTFLGKPEPKKPFPHANPAARREKRGLLARLFGGR